MNKKPRISLLVDNPQRDLPGMVLLGWQLCQRGAVCYLTPMNLREREIWALAPDLVLLNHTRTIYDSLMQSLIRAGIKYGVLDTEGGVFSVIPNEGEDEINNKDKISFDSYSKTISSDISLRKNALLVCSWTDVFRKHAIEQNWYDSSQIITTGPPRADYYSKKWRQVMLQNSKYCNRYPKPIVMLNASFPLANPRFQSTYNEAGQLQRNYDFSKKQVSSIVNGQRESMQHFLELGRKLASSLPKITFICRPHPFEDDGIYHEVFGQYSNVHVDRQGTVDGWLAHAQGVVHFGCTTAIEAALLNVPATHPSWLIEDKMPFLVRKVSIPSDSIDSMVQSLANYVSEGFHFSIEQQAILDSVIRDTFHCVDGNATERIASAIIDCCATIVKPVDISQCMKNHSKAHRKRYSQEGFNGFVKKIVGLSKAIPFFNMKKANSGFFWDQSQKKFELSEVQKLLSVINDVVNSRDMKSKKILADISSNNLDYLFGMKHGRSIKLIAEKTK